MAEGTRRKQSSKNISIFLVNDYGRAGGDICNMVVADTYISPPVVAALRACSRISAWRHFAAGDFGKTVRRSRVLYASVAEIEKFYGATFSRSQLDTAADGMAARVWTISQIEDAA
jgi:hypothetical protein